jgi:hypothetical protein
MPALVAGIHVFAELQRCKDVDGPSPAMTLRTVDGFAAQ